MLHIRCLVWLAESNNLQGWAVAYFTTYGCGTGTPADLLKQRTTARTHCRLPTSPSNKTTATRPLYKCCSARRNLG